MRIALQKQQVSCKSDFDLQALATYYTRPMRGPWEMAHPRQGCAFAAFRMRHLQRC
jgi:hypothetical protein